MEGYSGGSPEQFLLASREEIEAAWRLAATTGTAPNLESLLQLFVDNAPAGDDLEADTWGVGMSGDVAAVFNGELYACITDALENYDENTQTAKTARALVALLNDPKRRCDLN
jgi:hypothetical protein